MERTIQAWSLQVSFFLSALLDKAAAWAEHLSHTSHGSWIVSCCHDSATFKKKKEEKGVSSAALAKQHGFMTKSHKASGVGGVIVVEMMASRGVYVWGIVLLVFSVTAFVTYINQCPQWNGSLNLWFEKKSFGCLSHGWITEKAHWPHAQEPPEPVKKLWMFPVGKSSNFQRDAKWLQRDW